MEEKGVSIVCLTYNHQKYIRQCIEGFVSQKTDFPFEVIIHDDASTDDTAQIIREYEEKYPEIIKPIYEKENRFSKHDGSLTRSVLPYISGKYVALCEGDDYWTDETKLQKQFSAMQNHTNCRICLHRVNRVDEGGVLDGISFPKAKIETGQISSERFIELISTDYFQTSSYFVYAEEYKKYYSGKPEFAKYAPVGDEALLLYYGNLGEVYYFDEPMSSYRYLSDGGWSMRQKQKSMSDLVQHYDQIIAMLNSFDSYSNGKYTRIIEQRILRCQFACRLIEKDYRSALREEYRQLFAEMPAKSKVKVATLSFLQIFKKCDSI